MDKPCSKAAIKCTSFAMAQETVLPHCLFSDQDLLLHLLHSMPPTPCGCVLWPRLGKYLLLRSHLAIVSWSLFDSLTLGVPVFNCLHSRSLCAWIADCHLPSALPIWPKRYRWRTQGIFIEKTSQILVHALGVLHNHITKYESSPKELVFQLLNNKIIDSVEPS